MRAHHHTLMSHRQADRTPPGAALASALDRLRGWRRATSTCEDRFLWLPRERDARSMRAAKVAKKTRNTITRIFARVGDHFLTAQHLRVPHTASDRTSHQSMLVPGAHLALHLECHMWLSIEVSVFALDAETAQAAKAADAVVATGKAHVRGEGTAAAGHRPAPAQLLCSEALCGLKGRGFRHAHTHRCSARVGRGEAQSVARQMASDVPSLTQSTDVP